MSNPEHPDYLLIDLDPSDGDFQKAVSCARAAKKVLDRHKLVGFPKTSGKTGMHIYVPCEGLTFAQVRAAATTLCQQIHQLVPDISTMAVSTSSRGDKVYLDAGQNDFADTLASPYCVRPSGHPTVSTPLEWREVTAKLRPELFTIQTIGQRLKSKGDLFKGVLLKRHRTANSKRLWLLI